MASRTQVVNVLILSAAALAAPAGADAQTCGVRAAVSAVGGYASYDIAGGIDGPQLGADVSVDAAAVGLRLGVRTVVLEGEAPDPLLARVQVSAPIISFAEMDVCGDVHAGISRFSFSDDTGTVLAGGIGLTVAPATPGPIRPWLSVRGLAGWTSGTILDFAVDETGLSLGAEAGVAIRSGALSVRLVGAGDGFDGGLGPTPYPELSAELAIGYHF